MVTPVPPGVRGRSRPLPGARGLLFCDFKLENVIQTRHSLKLIDLGGVYRAASTPPRRARRGTAAHR
jgi:hypothetical protein